MNDEQARMMRRDLSRSGHDRPTQTQRQARAVHVAQYGIALRFRRPLRSARFKSSSWKQAVKDRPFPLADLYEAGRCESRADQKGPLRWKTRPQSPLRRHLFPALRLLRKRRLPRPLNRSRPRLLYSPPPRACPDLFAMSATCGTRHRLKPNRSHRPRQPAPAKPRHLPPP